MTVRMALALVTLVCARSAAGDWGLCDAAIAPENKTIQQITAITRCAFVWPGTTTPLTSVRVTGHMTFGPGGEGDVCQGAGSCGMSSAISPYSASTTYTATGTFTAEELFIPVGGTKTVTDSRTTAPPERPRTDPIEPIDKCQGGEPGWNTPCSPIVINLRNGPFKLTGPDDPVSFDIDGDGQAERITWTAGASLIAFLALDRNANASIDSGAELFGNATRLTSGLRAANGFEALIELDANRDGVVDRDDPVWPRLLLWTDENHDGASQPRELQAISGSGIEGLQTAYHWTGRHDTFGNLFGYQSLVRFDRGTRPAYDIYFRVVE